MAEEYTGGFLLIVIENVGADFVAYSPDLPGCVAAGASREFMNSAGVSQSGKQPLAILS